MDKSNNTISEALSNLQSFSIDVDVDKANLEYAEYGHVVAPLTFQRTNAEGKILRENIGRNAWFQFKQSGMTPSDAFKKTLSPKLTFLPNEKCDLLLEEVKELAEQEGIIMTKFKEYPNGKMDDKHRWVYLTNNIFDAEKGDKVKIGIAFKNGIGTGNALSSELFTYRTICSNGSIWGKRNFANARVVHMRTVDEMAEIFLQDVKKVFKGMGDIIRYYQAMPKIKFTQKQLDFLWEQNYISTKYLPDWIEVTRASKKKGLEETELKNTSSNATAWDFFNSITEAVTKNLEYGKRRISFDSFASVTQDLHSGMVAIVDKRI